MHYFSVSSGSKTQLSKYLEGVMVLLIHDVMGEQLMTKGGRDDCPLIVSRGKFSSYTCG